MRAYFDRFTIEMTKDQANTGSHQGQCDEDVAYLLTLPKIKRQLKKISDEDLAEELKEYTYWDVSDRAENEARIVWIAAGNILEGV